MPRELSPWSAALATCVWGGTPPPMGDREPDAWGWIPALPVPASPLARAHSAPALAGLGPRDGRCLAPPPAPAPLSGAPAGASTDPSQAASVRPTPAATGATAGAAAAARAVAEAPSVPNTGARGRRRRPAADAADDGPDGGAAKRPRRGNLRRKASDAASKMGTAPAVAAPAHRAGVPAEVDAVRDQYRAAYHDLWAAYVRVVGQAQFLYDAWLAHASDARQAWEELAAWQARQPPPLSLCPPEVMLMREGASTHTAWAPTGGRQANTNLPAPGDPDAALAAVRAAGGAESQFSDRTTAARGQV